MSALLSVTTVSYSYPGREILRSVSFEAMPGEFLVLLGANGAGKSTLLNLIAGLVKPQTGGICYHGHALTSIPAKQRPCWVGHLPQGAKHDLPFTVEQIVLMGRYPFADTWFESAADHAIAEAAMVRTGSIGFKNRQFSTLSGGEQQRVLLAACIAQAPKIMLFDEPSTYLDIHQQLQCFSTLAELSAGGALCIAVTHDLNLALKHCSRVLLLDGARLAADFPATEAAHASEWLSRLSPRLRLAQTAEGRPWVMY